MMCNLCFFFKQKTSYEMRISYWISDVCSSDLRGDGPLPGLQQHRLAVRRRPSALAPPPRHVGELEANHAPAVGGEAGGEEAHEGCVHRRAGAVGEGEGERRRSGRRIDEELRRILRMRHAKGGPCPGVITLP